tara:strand:+ start:1398 stop:1691 length:294 start_codon:yes stop_codon:yes gene_type:complete
MKLAKSQLKQIIKEELSEVLNENAGGYEWYLDSPYEGTFSDSENSLEDALEEAKHALNSFYKGAKLVAIFDPQGKVVHLGDGYDEAAALKIRQESQQ